MNQAELFRVIATWLAVILVPVVLSFVTFARWAKRDRALREKDLYDPSEE